MQGLYYYDFEDKIITTIYDQLACEGLGLIGENVYYLVNGYDIYQSSLINLEEDHQYYLNVENLIKDTFFEEYIIRQDGYRSRIRIQDNNKYLALSLEVYKGKLVINNAY